MKNIKSLLILLIVVFGLCMETNATDYCGVSYSVSSPVACTVHVAFYKEGTTYVTQIEVEGNHTLTRYSSGSYAGITLEGEGTSVLLFKSASQMTSWNFVVDGNASPVTIYNHQLGGTGKTNWDDVCSSAAANIIYFVNSWGWETPYVYLWQSSNASNQNAAWPGEPIKNTYTQISTTCTNAPVYAIEYNPDFDKVIFSNNGGSQTNDLNALEGRFYNPHPEENKGDEWYYSYNLYLKGSFNGWNETNKFSSWSSGATTVTTTVTGLSANTNYTFKIWQKDANRYYGNNGTINAAVNCWFMDPDAGNCTLHTKAAGDYTFTYDFAANRLSVAYPEEVGCTGTSTSCTSGGSEFVRYTVKYIGGNIIFSVRSTTANALQTCKLNYATGTSGQNGVTNVGMTISDGEATYTLPADGVYASGTLYFYFTYKTAGMGSEGSTTSGWNSAFQYNIGGCALDDGIPYMLSASKESATTTSVTLNVSGKVNVDGGAQETTQYRVSTDGGVSYTTYTATAGQITITDLTADTEYNFIVKAYYNGNVSENSKTVTAATNKVSQCSGERGHFVDASWAKIQYSIDYNTSTKQMTVTVTCATQTLNWLGIQWNVQGIAASAGMETSFTNGVYTTTVTDAMIGNAMGIRIEYGYSGRDGHSVTAENCGVNTTGVIYYVVGECGCLPDDGDNPMMGAVTVASKTSSTVILNVAATDPSSTVSTFVVNNKDYAATNGQITITGLNACTTYDWNVYAKDPSCNISANYTPVSVTTIQNHASAAAGATATFVYEGNTDFRGEKVIDGNLNSRGGTQYATPMTALEGAVFTVDMQQIRSINEIDIFWERACATDYELQASIDGTHWATISRYTDLPHYTQDAETRTRGMDNMVYSFYPLPARYLRVKPNTLYVAAQWGMSMYEFEAYGDCDAIEQQCPIMLGVRSVSTTSQTQVISVGAIDRQTPNPANLTYLVTMYSETLSGRTITNTYEFAPNDTKRVNLAETAQLTIEGLIPGTHYTVTVQAKDPQGNISCNSNSIDIRTGKAEGCKVVREGNDAKVEGDWKAFPAGMTYRLELENNDAGTAFTATLSFTGKPADMDIGTVYFAIQKQTTGTDCYAGWVEVAMTNNDDGTFSRTFLTDDTYPRDGRGECGEGAGTYNMPLFPDWPEVQIYFKMETNKGIIHTNEFDYNAAEKTCEEYFIIFHNGSEPANDMQTQFAGGNIEQEIFYYRLFNPGQWAPLCLPFNVDRVSVFDSEDKAYYNLTPQRNTNPSNNAAGTVTKGNYWIRQQKMDVSGEDFVDSWYDANDELPQKNVAYNFRVPTAGGYYQNKYIVFHGVANQNIASAFSLGAAPNGDDKYRLYGNNTMTPHTLTKAYKEDADGEYYRVAENWTLYPFECYVIASANTMKRMPIIGRWVVTDQTEGMEDIDNDAIQSEIHVYTVLGNPIASYYSRSLSEIVDLLKPLAGAGCYIVTTPKAATKIMIP